MNKDNHASIIIALTKLIADKQVHKNSIHHALSLLCESFNFDSSVIYEINQFNYLTVMQRYVMNEVCIQEEFHIDSIQPIYRKQLATNDFTILNNTPSLTNNEKQFLSLFDAQSIATITLVDEYNRIIGFIVFLNKNKHIELCADEMETLLLSFTIFGHYINIRMYQNKLSFAQYSLKAVLDNTGIDIYVNDFYNHDILYVNKSMAAPYGGISAFEGKKCFEVLYPGQNEPCEFCPQKKLIDDQGNPTKVYSWDYCRPFDGSWFRVFSAAFRWVDGRLAHVVSSADITDNKRNEELIKYMANYDSLTNLPNRRMLVQACDERINHAKDKEDGYILFLDIDDFKQINDQLGHDAGDEFLIQLGVFFSQIALLKNAIYRNGGDEFVAIIDGFIQEEGIRNLVQAIHDRFEQPWVLKKGNVYSNVSIGVAHYPEDGVTTEELLCKADHAMYQAKNEGKGKVCFGYELKSK